MPQVSIASDWTMVALPPSITPHAFVPLPPPAPLPSPVGAASEIPAPNAYPPGALVGKHKLTLTVLHKKQPISQQGHDLGIGIVHVQGLPAPNNALTIKDIALSSRASNFGASLVKMNGQPPSLQSLIALPPTPMTCCGSPFSVPTGDTNNAINSVMVNINFSTYMGCFAAMAGACLLEALLACTLGGFKADAADVIAAMKAGKGAFAKWAAKAILLDGVPGKDDLKSVKWWAEGTFKTAMSTLFGLAKEGKAKVEVGVGNPFFEAKGEVGLPLEDKEQLEGSFEARAAGALNAKVDPEGLHGSVETPTGTAESTDFVSWRTKRLGDNPVETVRKAPLKKTEQGLWDFDKSADQKPVILGDML